ncbi:MAG: A-macroglobulin complement component [Candidatus Adiutrix sp.]|jgi:hypothetical protein|nr:A-macroglobulin complement component [Candidatus Adiutrix sp.]
MTVSDKRLLGRLAPAALGLILLMLLAPAAPATGPDTPPLSPEQLGGPERNLVFLATDKPIYQPGETVYLRAVALQADTYFPVTGQPGPALFKITGPRDNELETLPGELVDSTAGAAWTIPAGTPGGRYRAAASLGGSPVSVRPFEIRAYQPPRLKSQIDFQREGYGPGDVATAVLTVTRAEGGIPAGAKITAIARIDGREAARVDNLTVDPEGRCQVSFTLPKPLELGEGTLALAIEDGGVVETAAKTIPILLQTLDLAFYPEGGDLVAGLPGRVYVQARRPDGKPADLTGEIIRVDAAGQSLSGPAVAQLATSHEGRGWVEFTPSGQERYALRLSRPAGLTRLFPLPLTRTTGATLRADRDTYKFDEPITLSIQATPDSGAAQVTLYHREKLVTRADLQVGQSRQVSLQPGEAEGVLMATVWAKNGQPLAERLIFREPKFKIQVGLTAEALPTSSALTPGGKVRLKLETKDESGRPVGAVVGLAVSDDATLEMVERRDQAPGLPVMVYLENEVNELADAQVYFDPANPQAAGDIDLLLATQGWRRFLLVRLDEALKIDPEGVRRALAIRRPEVKPAPIRPLLMREGAVLNKAQAPAADLVAAADFEAAPNEADGNYLVQDEKADRLDQALAGPAAAEKRIWPAPRPPKPAVIGLRQYAHQARPGRQPGDRQDFTETIFWHAGLRTSPRDGSAVVEFDLSDSVTTFRVRADALGANGALGQAGAEIVSLEPFYAEVKLPPAAVAGDHLKVPVTLVNSTGQGLERPGLLVQSDELKISPVKVPARLAPGGRERILAELAPERAGAARLTLKAAAGPYADTVSRNLTVLPRGFPVSQTASGLLGPDQPFSWSVTLAQDLTPGSLSTEAKVYPTPLANLEEALNALLRQPHGCFEQTSSTSYPLVMAQQYFLSHTGVDPDKIKRAEELLKDSYQQLVSFESPQKGYEWFGQDPGHEALTAYGLMQFKEMRAVRPVDEAMIGRTQKWLMDRRDGQGGFKRNEQALDTFGGAPAPLTNLYILWTLLESGQKPESLKAELEAARTILAETKDAYLLSLGANIFYLADEGQTAQAAARALAAAQAEDGRLPGAETSITRSGGLSLEIETTSLAIIAWLRLGETYTGPVEKAMKWLFENCQAGRFGSTQSTILALKAINAYDQARSRPLAPGSVQLVIDGQPFGRPLPFDQQTKGALELPDFAAKLAPGQHRLELAMTGGSPMPFTLNIGYNTSRPESSPECPLRLSTSLSRRQVKEGEPVDLSVGLSAQGAEVPLPLAVIGLPAGLAPRHERLKEMVAAGQVAAYDIKGRELTLYWRNLKGDGRIDLTIPLTAEIPGRYTAPASRAYGYYLDEHKDWQAGESLEISPLK